MSSTRKAGIRVIRKSAHLTNKIMARGARFTRRIEDKTTRILTGKDFSILLVDSIPIEKALFNGIDHNIAPLNPALPALGRKGKVTILIPSLNNRSFFGGTATALIIAAKLAIKTNKQLRIIETLESGSKNGLDDFLQSNQIFLPGKVEVLDVSARTYNRYGYIDLHPDDILVASAWWDAKLLSQLPLNRKFIYLIQDFEPIFYSNSDEYILAESTYKTNDFIPVCNTKLMHTFMSIQGYEYIKKHGLWFEPAVSNNKHGISIKNNGRKRMFLYGRPSVDRNLFYTALASLNRVFNSGGLDPNEWEIFMAGQDKIPSIMLSNGIPIQNLGKLSMEDYTNFMHTVDLALSPMMAPHPNYPTLEFASVGAAVVSTKYETKQDLTGYSKNIFMADLNIDSIAESIVQASKLSYDERIANLNSNHIEADWDSALESTLSSIVKSY